MKKFRAPLFVFALAAVSMVLHAWGEWKVFVAEQTSHQEAAALADFKWRFLSATMENWQSEFVQLGVQFLMLAGIFAFARVYEQDQGEVKEGLDALRELIAERRPPCSCEKG